MKTGLVVGILIALVLLTLFLATGDTECEDRACFEENADLCRPATWTAKFETAIIKHTIKSGCVLEKIVLDTEDEESKHLVGKELRCPYQLFDSQLIDNPLGTSSCTGSLRES